MDRLLSQYNQMLDQLYAERLAIGEQRGFVEQFLQATPVGVLLSDFSGRINVVNDAMATMLGTEVDALKQRSVDQLKTDLGRAISDLETGESRVHAAADSRRFRVSCGEFTDRGFTRRFWVVEEVTRLLDESERSAYHQLVRIMSHEVNNSVAATNSLLQSCLHYGRQLDEDDAQEFANALTVVMKRNEHLNHFMAEFAKVVRLPDPKPRPTDLEAMLDRIETMFSADCAQHAIHWQRTGPPLPELPVDPEQFEQVLINIIKNAIEAMSSTATEQRELLLDTTPARDGTPTLSISDTGPGLPVSDQRELFVPFYTSKPKGQGLGLTLVKEVLLRHGLAFSLRSESDRTIFIIAFDL